MALTITVKSANNTQPKKDFFMNLLNYFNIKVNDVFAKEKSFTTICSTADDADNLCSVEVINVLLQAGMTPIPSPELKARRSVIAKNVSSEILNSPEEVIKEEFHRANDSVKSQMLNHIKTINKFQNFPFLKITFDSINISNNCLKLGLNFRHLHIPDHQFENERFKEIKYCYRCYAMNSQLANKCSKPPDYKICSKCSSTDNIWSNCTSATVKCVNCGDPHVTRSPSCPTRKDLLKVNQHPSSKFRFSENDFPCLINSPPQANAYKSCEEEEPRISMPTNFEKICSG